MTVKLGTSACSFKANTKACGKPQRALLLLHPWTYTSYRKLKQSLHRCGEGWGVGAQKATFCQAVLKGQGALGVKADLVAPFVPMLTSWMKLFIGAALYGLKKPPGPQRKFQANGCWIPPEEGKMQGAASALTLAGQQWLHHTCRPSSRSTISRFLP